MIDFGVQTRYNLLTYIIHAINKCVKRPYNVINQLVCFRV